jgi:methylase of polypeptide subunit release factors
VDFCTGTGCIALLLYSHLTTPSSPFQHLSIIGVDISPLAISLSELNLDHNISLGHIPPPTRRTSISMVQSSIFSPDWVSDKNEAKCDILISNPPYISPRGFNTDVARSVRNHEPKLAQVPEPHHTHHSNLQEQDVGQEDVFYARLLDIGAVQHPSVMLFETGGMEQAKRVVEMAGEKLGMDDWKMEIWRDWPDARPEAGEEMVVFIEGLGEVEVKGSGHGRSVFIYRK